MRILLVEDSKTQALQLSSLLGRHGYTVDVADSGEAALAWLAHTLPDAIVSDVVMPGIDGFELCARIKASPRTEAVPVMLLTGRGDIRHVLRALASRADNFVTRPHDDAQLLARLTRMLAARNAPTQGPVDAVVDGERFVLSPSPHAWIEVLVSSLEDGARAEAALRDREAALEIERARAEEANRAKDGFLAVVSHELRTPLTAVLGWVHLLREGTVPEDERPAALERLERSAQAQAHLIEDLLDASRIVHGGFKVIRAPVDLLDVASSSVNALTATAQVRGIALTFAHDDGPFAVRGDARRLEQVLWNLIQNALKFTPSGGAVRVSLQARPDAFEITVADNGRGIDPPFLPHVFARFRQETGVGDRARTGLGLGLAIVQHLIEAHGGTVTAASDGIGHGATFVVKLPRSIPTAIEPVPATDASNFTPEPVSDGLDGVRVLLHESDLAVRSVLARVLEGEGATVIPVGTPEDLTRALSAGAIDVVLSGDGEDDAFGATFLKTVRRAGCQAPAAALTSNARPAARARAFAAGFADHLTRPGDPHELVLVLARLAHPVPPSEHESRP